MQLGSWLLSATLTLCTTVTPRGLLGARDAHCAPVRQSLFLRATTPPGPGLVTVPDSHGPGAGGCAPPGRQWPDTGTCYLALSGLPIGPPRPNGATEARLKPLVLFTCGAYKLLNLALRSVELGGALQT